MKHEGSDGEDNSKREKKAVSWAYMTSGDIFTNSEVRVKHLRNIRDLKIVVLTMKMRHTCISKYFK